MIYYILSIQLIGIIIGYLNFKNIFNLKRWSLMISILNMILVFIMTLLYNNNNNEFQFRKILYISDSYYFSFGVDGINLSLLLLTTIIFPILYMIDDVKESISNILNLLIIEFILIILFLTMDIGLFFIFFEFSLIPLIFFIGLFGASNNLSLKLESMYRIFIYTIIGSFFMLISILYLIISFKTTNNELLWYFLSSSSPSHFIYILFLISFFIKIPVYPFHLWLPFAHSEASTRGSVILAALILKLGGYAILRFSLLWFYSFNLYYSPIIYIIIIFSVFIGSLITLRQIDLKVLIAYSSIVHMSFSLFGLFSDNINGLSGAFYTLFSHAFISGGLFILIGFLYNRYHTRIFFYFRGISSLMPIFSIYFLIISLANMSIPLTASFIGEILIFSSVIHINNLLSIFCAISLLFTTIFMLNLINRVLYGKISPFLFLFNDLTISEFYLLFPLFFFILLFGFFTNSILDISILSLSHILF